MYGSVRHFDMIIDQIFHNEKNALFSFSLYSPVYTKYDSNPISANIMCGLPFSSPIQEVEDKLKQKCFEVHVLEMMTLLQIFLIY